MFAKCLRKRKKETKINQFYRTIFHSVFLLLKTIYIIYVVKLTFNYINLVIKFTASLKLMHKINYINL